MPRIPAPNARKVEIRIANILDRDHFGEKWRTASLTRDWDNWWSFDFDGLVSNPGLADGSYEYEFIIDGDVHNPVADPFANEITRFGGYRGVVHIRGGRESPPSFDWSDELPAEVRLPENNEIVIYEMPMRWMDGDYARQVGLGTFEEIVFAHLEKLRNQGINCIELLPAQDSADTLYWGYGSRFFFAPDLDMGGPIDLKVLIKRCHQLGIRVILDVVMNHERDCPLERLAFDWFFLRNAGVENRNGDWGTCFRFQTPSYNNTYPARDFHYAIAQYWIEQYHIDGFRLDEFKSINCWDFVQDFTRNAERVFQVTFKSRPRPFIIIAEDSNRKAVIVKDDPRNPNGKKIVYSMWNFAYSDEIRRLVQNEIKTSYGAPSFKQRASALIKGNDMFESFGQERFREGFSDTAQMVNYISSHDVQDRRRLMNVVFGSLLQWHHKGSGDFTDVRGKVDTGYLGEGRRGLNPFSQADYDNWRRSYQDLFWQALGRVRSAHAILMTSVGIPMLLAGEEFADIHDLDPGAQYFQQKMSDPVDWSRRNYNGHRQLADAVSDLIFLRTGHPALRVNEVDPFYFHPECDTNDGPRVFAYCRTAGRSLGTGGQVVVVANAGPQNFPSFTIPWPWTGGVRERGAPVGGQMFQPNRNTGHADLALDPMQVRVFETY